MDPSVSPIAERVLSVTNELVARLGRETFSAPVSHVYNPLVYARKGFDRYIHRFGQSAKQVIFVGMNPGPFGMVQTGVPFGDVQMVMSWMGIQVPVAQPENSHPKRPVQGFSCARKEVSGRRLWGWAKERFGTPESFFSHFLVVNYCPLAFMEESGRNRTPDKLPLKERNRLFAICDHTLFETIATYRPRWAIGIGGFAEKRIQKIMKGLNVSVGRITHPSPANPFANRGWIPRIESELAAMGIEIPKTHNSMTR
jgi:single-strand selective monofunctional uracil DNA glycosylase